MNFLKMCLSGARRVPVVRRNITSTTKYEKQEVMYHPTVVEKAVHLLRNPFDNLVSRFHHEQKEYKKKGNTEWLERFSNDVAGFRKWCGKEDRAQLRILEVAPVDWARYGYPEDISRYFGAVTCHADFFRYAQWHRFAIETAEMLALPVLHVYYEDYATNLTGSTDEMLKFLNLDRVGKLPDFDSDKDYSEFFTQEERASASDLMRKVVGSEKGEELLERYFVDYNFEKLRDQAKSIA